MRQDVPTTSDVWGGVDCGGGGGGWFLLCSIDVIPPTSPNPHTMRQPPMLMFRRALVRRCYSTSAALPTLTPPPASFTRAELAKIQKVLLPAPMEPIATLAPHTLANMAKPPREAAVLIPLCNIGGVAHLLMEVRAAGLRVHASEAR